MRSKSVPLILMLTLTLLTILPSSYIGLNRAHAFNQDPKIPATNLPFGPQADQIVFQYYSDFTTMFNAFTTGGPNGIDITDWPMFPADSGITSLTGSFCETAVHPDFYCGAPNVNFGLFQVDMNHLKTFLGVNQLQSRVAPTVSVTLTAGPAGCSTGFGSVGVQLQNQETNARDQLFAVNNMTLTQVLTGGVLSSSTTLPGTSGTGVYNFPCVVAGTYLLSNSAYANCSGAALANCEVSICPTPCTTGTTATVTFHSAWNSNSNKQYTQAGIWLREGIRHLVDKPQFILGTTLQGQAQCSDVYAAAPQGFANGFCSNVAGFVTNPLPTDVLKAECPAIAQSETTQGIPVAQQLSCAPIDAYLLNETAIGQTNVWWGATGPFANNGFASKQDIRAACDFFVLAGFAVTPSGNTCIDVANAAQGTATKASYPHNTLPSGQQLIFYDRTHHPRRAFGQITIDGLNFLFGTANNGAASGNTVCAINYGFKSPSPGCTPAYYGFTEISGIIFADGVNANTWNLYTGGESFSINPDNEYTTFNSIFASNYCGGAAATVISNYDIVCDPQLDAYTAAGEFADTFTHAVNIFQNATYISTEHVSANPVYNLQQRFVALNSLNFGNTASSEGSLVNGDGTGWQAGTVGAFSTLLNAHCNPNYTPVSSAFACGGADGTIRHGQSQDSDTFSPYQATSVWDFDVIDMVWDTMLFVNPDTGGSSLQLSNYMVVSHTTHFDGAESSTSPGLGTVVGTTTQVWKLRPDLQFHDLTPVTADDICFSILSYRDMPSALLQPSVINVASCTQINASTVQVKLGLTGPFYDDLIGGIPILPHHVWAAACNWPVGTPEPSPAVLGASQCANPADDPMVPLSGQTTGRMIGSGAYMCLGVAGTAAPGVPGGPCSQTASGAPGTSSNTLGGRLLLTKFQGYHRGSIAQQGSKYQKFSWADKFGAASSGVVTIADISDAAIHNKRYDPYWASPLYSSSSTGACSLFEPVVYDSNNNNVYDSGETVVQPSDPASALVVGTVLKTDPLIKFVDANANGLWDPGEVAVYDANNNGIYDPGVDTVITSGAPPATGSALSTDSHLKYWDFNGGNTWDAGGIGTGNFQCVDIGDIGTIALYKGIGATDPISLSTYVGLDPHFDRFNSGVQATAGSVYLGSTSTLKGQTSASFTVFVGTTVTVTSVSVIGTTGPTSTTPGTCTATLVAPDGPGRTTYTCTFGTALAPDLNRDTELEITLTFSNGVTTEVEIGQSANSLLPGFAVAPPFPGTGQSVTFTANSPVQGSPGYTPSGAITYSWSVPTGGVCGANGGTTYTCTFNAVGTFTVQLTETDAAGVSGTLVSTVLVGSFTVDFTSTTSVRTVAFDGTTPGATNGNPPFTYSWNFGDGTTGTGATPSHTYTAAGTYNVILTATDSTGDIAVSPTHSIVIT